MYCAADEALVGKKTLHREPRRDAPSDHRSDGCGGQNDGGWDVYITHGETHSEQGLYGFGDLRNYQNIVTSANYGRGAVVLAPGVTAPNTGSGGTATCTTGLSIFDQFTISQDCFLAVTADAVDTTRIGQDIVEGTVQGRIATMKAGELRFAAGASYRQNDIDYRSPPRSTARRRRRAVRA